ncbi:enoyl-CoA hydratase-related protein [Reyranella sp.]|uniref:enoyl-CoA hydratase-related protein n=1 Tax=Reyranella sp. TaxID=1929291 RepID=UPI003D1379F5
MADSTPSDTIRTEKTDRLMLRDEFDPGRALQIGLVQEVVPAGRQIERALEIARRIARNALIGLRAMKEAALKYIQAGEATAVAAIPSIHAAVMETGDAKEGIRSFIERRESASIYELRSV